MKARKFKIYLDGKECEVEVKELEQASTEDVAPRTSIGKHATLTVGGVEYRLQVEEMLTPAVRLAETVTEDVKGKAAAVEGKAICAPMQGTITKVLVRVNDKVKPGDAVLLLEAMKMENVVESAVLGVVKAINVAVGDTVAMGDALIIVE